MDTEFQIGDYVVCPGHGVGQISNIDQKDLGAGPQSFYIIKIVSNGMTVMVPTTSRDQVRNLVQQESIDRMFDLLKEHDVKVDNSTWNRRHRDYLCKIKTGSIIEIADVLRSLFLLKNVKSLSFGEKKLMEQCKGLITKEVSIVKGQQEVEISAQIEACFPN